MNQIRTESLERALPAIAGIIANRTGIKVVRGEKAATDGKVICLPKFNDLSLTPTQVAKAVGLIYHEDGHILHSTFGSRLTQPVARSIENVLEDIRIEQKMMRTHPAARRYLNETVNAYVAAGLAGAERHCFAIRTEQDSEARILQAYMLYRLRHDVLRQQGVAPVLGPTAQAAKAKFSAGLMVRLDALMFEVSNCESTEDVQALSLEIVKMIKEEKEKQEEQRQQSQSSVPDAPQGAAGEGEGGNGAEPGSDSALGGLPSGVDDGDEGGNSSQEGVAHGAGGTGSGDLDSLLDMGEDELDASLGEMLAQELGELAEEHDRNSTKVTMPNIHRFTLRNGTADIAALKASINAIRTKTLQWMASVTETDDQHAKAGLMLDFTRLSEARLGGDIFVSRTEGIDLNAAVSIVIDRSGSMSCTIQQAAQAAVAAMLAFDVPGIETQVAVFPAYGNINGVYDEGVAVVKRWDEPPARLAGRIASLTTDGGTPMAEAVLFAAADIVHRPETLKLVMVVTDGDPDNVDATRAVIDRVRQSGISVVGLGIGVDPTAVFGDRFAAPLHDVRELSSAMVRLVKSSMLRH